MAPSEKSGSSRGSTRRSRSTTTATAASCLTCCAKSSARPVRRKPGRHRQETCFRVVMATTWILAADSSRARILQVLDREHRLAEIEDLYNPSARLNEREMTSDAEPRFRGSDGPGSDREAKGAVEHAVETFAKT